MPLVAFVTYESYSRDLAKQGARVRDLTGEAADDSTSHRRQKSRRTLGRVDVHKEIVSKQQTLPRQVFLNLFITFASLPKEPF